MTNPEPQPLQPAPYPIFIAPPPRPGTVTAASVLMWTHFMWALCLPAALAMALVFRLADSESGPMDSSEAGGIGLVAALFLLLAGALYTLIGILAVKLLRGRRWARTSTLVMSGLLLVVFLFGAVPPLLSGIPTPALLGIALEGSIAGCLCTPSARAWFTNPRNESEDPLVAAWKEGRD